MNLTYEPAAESDIPVIFEQAKSLIDTYEDTSSIDYDRVLAWVRGKITTQIGSYTCVSFDGTKCAYYRLSEEGEVDDLYVLPGFRNQGIGSEILIRCITESPQPLWLYVFSRNIRAVSFYERFGFAVREQIGATRLIMDRNG